MDRQRLPCWEISLPPSQTESLSGLVHVDCSCAQLLLIKRAVSALYKHLAEKACAWVAGGPAQQVAIP